MPVISIPQMMDRLAMPAFMASFSPDHGNDLAECAFNVANCLRADPFTADGRDMFVGNLGCLADAVGQLGNYEGETDFVADNVRLPGGAKAASFREVADSYRRALPDEIKLAQGAIAKAARGALDGPFARISSKMDVGEAGIPPARRDKKLVHPGLEPGMLRVLADWGVISSDTAKGLLEQLSHNLGGNIEFLEALEEIMPIRGMRVFVAGFSLAVMAASFFGRLHLLSGPQDVISNLGVISALIGFGYAATEIYQYCRTRDLRSAMGLPSFPRGKIGEMLAAQQSYVGEYERVFKPR